MNHLIIKIIKIYQITLSAFIRQHCRFTPTCSKYTIKAIQQHGVAKGLYLSVNRICRCHPWANGGVDEVPTE